MKILALQQTLMQSMILLPLGEGRTQSIIRRQLRIGQQCFISESIIRSRLRIGDRSFIFFQASLLQALVQVVQVLNYTGILVFFGFIPYQPPIKLALVVQRRLKNIIILQNHELRSGYATLLAQIVGEATGDYEDLLEIGDQLSLLPMNAVQKRQRKLEHLGVLVTCLLSEEHLN